MSDTVVPCPNCGRETVYDQTNPDRPFCCERCRLIDLGAWADGRYTIAGEPVELPEGLHPDTDTDGT